MTFDSNQPAYRDLRNIIAERTSPIIAWVGAGLSMPANFPSWSLLKEKLLTILKEKAATMDDEGKKVLLKQFELVKRTSDFWLAFLFLKKALGDTTYRDSIRNEFKSAASIKIPEVYTYLWKLNIGGILNLNIDRLATRAHNNVWQDKPIIEFCGGEIAEFVHLLKGTQQFVANLHGHHENVNSWVFTKSDLGRLFENQGYRTFIQSCLTTRTIIFIGISADDIAVGGHLENLCNDGIDFGSHYWITDRSDIETDEWAEKLKLRIIRYSNLENHKELVELFKDILTYLPKDENAPPIEPDVTNDISDDIPDPNELVKYDANYIRKILNKKAKEILSGETKQYEEYERFCQTYDEAIYRAWYTSHAEGKNEFFNYRLENFHAKGAFGRVYKARDKEGNVVAIKILLEEERTRQDFLQSFRRGVRSMRILADRGIEGMVKYKEANEIPAFVVMDWINGPNLKEVIESKQISSWFLILKISTELASIIESAHRLPERVLHRDIRPPNIMLKNFYDGDDWEIVVLDFDLSWHVGAFEKSVIDTASATCFLAPEQIQKLHNVSTRHSAVDSFGLGMTLFYLIARRNPLPAEQKHKNWEINVMEEANKTKCSEWISVPNRFSRLIINCTKDEQSERWDILQIKNELIRLKDVILNPTDLLFAEITAEEIMARSIWGSDYHWDYSDLSAVKNLSSGISIKLVGHESKKKIILHINWQNVQVAKTKNIRKWLPKAKSQVVSKLKQYNWKVEMETISGHSLNIIAAVEVTYARDYIKALAKSLDESITLLKF